MEFEEEHLDLLQNIEFAVITEYRADTTLMDVDVRDAMEALARHYQAEELQRTPPASRLASRAQKVFDSVRSVCESRLGRPGGLWRPEQMDRLNTPAEIIGALKRIRKSVDLWNKRGGRQGYLSFVKQYV